MDQGEEIFKRIDSLMKTKNHKQKELDIYLGLARGTYTNWSRNKSKSFMSYLKEISEFLEVTPNYLILGRDDVKEKEIARVVSAEEAELLEEFSRLPPKDKIRAIHLLRAFADG